jgi:dihydroorotate dehydrogenase (NAD+) catalytic subunit
MINLSVNLAPVNKKGLILKNPLLLASGTCGYISEIEKFADLNVPGAFVSKGTTLKPREGNPQPRIVEVDGGILNAIGLENIGVEAVVNQKAPQWKDLDISVLVNIAGSSIDEYAEVAGRLEDVPGIAGIELNISCPNVRSGGIEFGIEPEMAGAVTQAVKKITSQPLVVKLAPVQGRIDQIAKAVAAAGADAITLINTFKGMAIDIHKRRPLLGNITGGLSGPVLKPVALAMVYEVAGMVEIPVIACGGVSTAEDAIEFIMAGASAFQVGTAFMVDPGLPSRIVSGIERFLNEQGVCDVAEIRGCARF